MVFTELPFLQDGFAALGECGGGNKECEGGGYQILHGFLVFEWIEGGGRSAVLEGAHIVGSPAKGIVA